ncbi:MAG: prepilin-type N-terminal cleavage/methylation domain-containing protein [Ignavibacteriales bacterium]
MRNNKGFTLIELLAVIVILAIIALIASPIIIGLIDDARKEAAASSGHGVYGAAQNVFAKVLIKNQDGLKKQLKYTFGTGGSVTITSSTDGTTWAAVDATELTNLDVDAATIALDFNGTKPTGGSITIGTTGQVTVVTDLTINGYTCVYSNQEFDCN